MTAKQRKRAGGLPFRTMADALDRTETPWQRTMLRVWEESVGHTPALEFAGVVKPNGLTYIQIGMVPSAITCIDCKEPSLLFPPDRGVPHMSNGLSGYVLCPRCSFGLSDAEIAA